MNARQAFLADMRSHRIGERIICNGKYGKIRDIRVLPPGHSQSPIRSDYFAIGFVTKHGVRWYGESVIEMSGYGA